MGIARARVVEVHAPASAAGRVGAGYIIGDRLVLTASRLAGRVGPTAIRPAGTGTWLATSPVWTSGDAAVLEVDDPSALMLPQDKTRWGRIAGSRPVPVTAMGFPSSVHDPAEGPTTWPRDATQFLGRVVPGDAGGPLTVDATTAVGDGMAGAALFAGAELVGVLLAGTAPVRTAPVATMADDEAFVELLGGGDGLALTPVSAPAYGFPMLAT
jgi:hypothetical protein